MDRELIFKTNSIFNSISFDINAGSWSFGFANKIGFFVDTLWRILKDRKIYIVSKDHGHQFGLPKPLNLVEEASSLLEGQILLEIKVKKDTADLLLTLGNNLQIEIFISSSGYESYSFSIDKKSYIGMGSGDIAIFDSGLN